MSTGLLASIDRSTQLAGHNRLALLLFRLHGLTVFGINVFKVQEVMPAPAWTWLPGAHPLVQGMADFRGRMIPVIDLSKALGQSGQAAAAHLVVTEYNRSVQGFLVQGVDRIIQVDVGQVMPPPGSDDGQGYLTGVTQHQDELVEIIDVERVLAEVVGEQPALSPHLLARSVSVEKNQRVLVVDDSRVARNQVERVLTQLGVSCVLAGNGREALQILKRMAADGLVDADQLLMVISDIEMPDMDGYTLTTEIRCDPALSKLFVMLHTSLSGVFNKAMVQKVGADRFIAKFNHDDLAEGVLERLAAVSSR